MRVNLLYADKDWTNTKSYYDWSSMEKDLGLTTLYALAERDLIMKNGKVMYVDREDPFLAEVMKKVIRVPLENKEELYYRQEVLQDCFAHEGIVDELYHQAEKVMSAWDKLGRKEKGSQARDSKAGLITEIRVFNLLYNGMEEVKKILCDAAERFSSRGFLQLNERILENFSFQKRENLEQILKDLSFYADISISSMKKYTFRTKLPSYTISCNLYDGLKLGNLKLNELETVIKSNSDPNSIVTKLQGQLGSLNPNTISLYKDTALQDDAAELEYQVVRYVMNCCSELIYSLGTFFEQFHVQIGFCRAAINVRHNLQRYGLEYCFPQVGEGALRYENLQELVMRVEQGKEIVGNDGTLDGKRLVIITGANQGGKSTYLRSVGIAQVMMQCGLMVAAKSYSSELYPNFFTHFTRREDSAMNSGRLDEELRRMDRIINHLGENSLLLFNESFATTTEKEGSVIAYDIIKALKEEGVRILTVTHLLSFAQKLFEEEKNQAESDVAFLSAEHLSDGTRTFKMIPHEPELTSFGLELFEQVLGRH